VGDPLEVAAGGDGSPVVGVVGPADVSGPSPPPSWTSTTTNATEASAAITASHDARLDVRRPRRGGRASPELIDPPISLDHG